MNLSDALAEAAANGWTDCSEWTPSFIAHQMSSEKNGFLASVSVQTSGVIKWSVLSLTGKVRTQKGTAPSVAAALAACDNTLAETTGTLF